tara:strand:+ start:1575 stop:1778 length:204 start_codon:yes stop_codon:yes gene_type:complete
MNDKGSNYSKDELDNHSNQLNENNDSYWQSRGYDERLSDWDDDSYDSSDDRYDDDDGIYSMDYFDWV